MSKKVLLVDDETHLLDSLRLTLRKFDITTDADPVHALELVKQEDFAVVISDMRMPVMDGVELLRAISHESPNTVRIMLTGHGDMTVAMKAINTGGVYKFMTKPVDAKEIRQTVTEALEEHDRLLQTASMQEAALHDGLTGLPNRTLFMDRCNIAIANAQRSKTNLAIFFLDLDGFKDVNDTYGHDAGDQILIETSKRLSDRIRANDTAARLGGDEFVILLTDLNSLEPAHALADEMVHRIAEPIPWKGNELQVGSSLGVAFYPQHGDTIETVMTAADAAMYKAKKEGGRRVVIAEG
ncbi:diguanylate cyclase [Pseudodesulfovibrio sp. zrk46]|uniref:diguanylate cyclase domain-containing protein n=1 Tax=Pseudodesulfovibrio sp. zrk46 TaxID=2725288 RepID=UPI0014492393|nr:diguanylate cyclase [Pseudodesulfovibrio sp. zrk46]QJB55920.1 diguanylate cyclase [Pseudodesulfovibrio sp. zrk46]